MSRNNYISEDEFVNIFADNLRDIMKDIGINQIELAHESGLDKTTISRYLKKQRMPSLKAVVNICYVLNCRLDDLVPTYDLID